MISLWYAVSKTGQGGIYTSCPERNGHFGTWVGERVGCISSLVMMMEADGLPLPLIRWQDEPVRMTLSLGY